MHYIAVILWSDFPKTSFHYSCLYADQRAKLHETKHRVAIAMKLAPASTTLHRHLPVHCLKVDYMYLDSLTYISLSSTNGTVAIYIPFEHGLIIIPNYVFKLIMEHLGFMCLILGLILLIAGSCVFCFYLFPVQKWFPIFLFGLAAFFQVLNLKISSTSAI